MTERLLKIALVLFLTAITGVRIFSGIDEPVARWDEQTNLQVMRETEAQQSFPVLRHLNEPFFEKPPLWYALSLLISDADTITVEKLRSISVICAFLIIGCSVIFVWKRFGFVSGVVTWMMFVSAHQLFSRNAGGLFSTHTLTSADSDSLQILFMIAAFVAGASKHRFAYILCGVATGLAVLTKGPLGFVPLISLTLLKQQVGVAWIIAAALILPWYVFMYAVFGEVFVRSHVLYHLINRAVTPLEGHAGALWYYLLILADPRVYPSFLLVIISILLIKLRSLDSFFIRYCGLTALLLFMIPSITGTKLAWYILPLYPFLAILTGAVLGNMHYVKRSARR